MDSFQDPLSDVFEHFLKGPRIFIDREVLRPDYIPNTLPHRGQEIIHLGKILAPSLDGVRASNILIYGKTGTGKTAVTKYTLERLTKKGKEIGASIRSSYVNCRIAGTPYRVLASLCHSVGLEIPFTGLATGEVFDRLKSTINNKHLLLICVLDEIDALVKDCGDSLLYELTRINEELGHGKLTIIGISNDLRFKDLLDPRVLSSLSEEEVIFNPYTAFELKDILRERVKIALVKDRLSSGALNLCSALAAAEHGDARRALDLLRVAGEIVEREGASKISEEHVKYAKQKIERDRVVEVLVTLPLHSKIVMLGIFLLKKANYENSVTGDLYEVYKEVCLAIGIDPLTQRRVSGLINELDIVGLINARVVSFGRYGRTKKVRLAIPQETLSKIFKEDSFLASMVNHTPKCLIRKTKRQKTKNISI
ncbi:MAG: ORC1-type DNA replication protein [Candidatus Bathyarchaeota archaeon]|nr:MAG: ORC1-type DNA replication protein [Candidatus Bathyarchaeota archaeon]